MKPEDIENWVERFNEALAAKQEIPWFDNRGQSVGDVIAAEPDATKGQIITTIKLKNGDIVKGSIS